MGTPLPRGEGPGVRGGEAELRLQFDSAGKCNPRQNRVDISNDIVVAHAQYPYPDSLDLGLPLVVVGCTTTMRVAIQLNRKLMFVVKKIDNVMPDGVLSAELQTEQLSRSQP